MSAMVIFRGGGGGQMSDIVKREEPVTRAFCGGRPSL